MKKKLFLLVLVMLLVLLVTDCSRTTFVSYANELESRTNENSSDNEHIENNPAENAEAQSEDTQANEVNDMEEMNDNEDESSLEDMEENIEIQCNEITIEDIKNLKIFNKYGKVLKIGDEGELVKSLHTLLKWLNYDVDDTSSIFTLQTKEAVIKFQENHSMKGIGVVDKLTYIRLNDFIYHSKMEFEYIDFDVKMGPTEDYWIIINKTTNVLQLYKGENRLNIYRIATGRYPSFTPEGKFEIANKLINAAWKDVPGGVASNPLGSRWMGLSIKNHWTYGVHGCGRPESVGNYASAGCIRMYNFQAEELYDLVPVHTPVWIGTTDKIEEWVGELNKTYEEIQREEEESKVQLYEEVMMMFINPFINQALVEYYGEYFSSDSKSVEIVSIEKEEEHSHIVIILIEVSIDNETDTEIQKDQIIIKINLNESKIEVKECQECHKDGDFDNMPN